MRILHRHNTAKVFPFRQEMFSFLSFAVLVIGAIGANDFEIRHSIELGSIDEECCSDVNDVTLGVRDELDQLICTEYDELVDDCSIEGMIEFKMIISRQCLKLKFRT